MILDLEKLGRIIVLHILIGALLYWLTPIAAFAYYVAATIIGAIQNYRAWENIHVTEQVIQMYRDKVPELDRFIKEVDEAYEQQ